MHTNKLVRIRTSQNQRAVKKEKVLYGCISHTMCQRTAAGAVSDSSGVQCDRHLTGKNPTNLAMHLRTAHKEVYVEFCTKNDKWKGACSAKPISTQSAVSSSTAQKGNHTRTIVISGSTEALVC